MINAKSIAFITLFIILISSVVAEDIILPVETQDLVNETNSTLDLPQIEDISLKNFIPKEFKLGDAQFSIQIQNNKNETLTNVMAFVSGKGFSTYDIAPIETLDPGEKGYLLVNGNFKESGLIPLAIKINQNTIYQNVTVLGETQKDIERAEQLLKEQEAKKKTLADLSSSLETLKQNFSSLESTLSQKEKDGYDIKGIKLDDLRDYIKDAQAGIFGEHVEDARININLAAEEYESLESKIPNLQKISIVTKFKDNAVIFSSIAGAIITFFALYELLKKKSSSVTTTVTTKITSIKQRTDKSKEQNPQEKPNPEKKD